MTYSDQAFLLLLITVCLGACSIWAFWQLEQLRQRRQRARSLNRAWRS
jgi:cbb3-type cytochrome oxidase subunit 3